MITLKKPNWRTPLTVTDMAPRPPGMKGPNDSLFVANVIADSHKSQRLKVGPWCIHMGQQTS